MDKKTEMLIVILVLLGGGLAYGISQGYVPNPFTTKFEVANNCQDVFCNQYHFACCVEDTLNPETKNAQKPSGNVLSVGYAVQCPSYASKNCITNGAGTFTYWQTCTPSWSVVGDNTIWTCSNRWADPAPNGWIFSTDPFYITVYKLKVFDCGTSACSAAGAGVEILGASGCSFVTNQAIYDENGNLVQSAQQGVDYQVTVPKGRCYQYTTGNFRTVCGNTCESCSSDSDCVAGHSYRYNYQGSTYGAEFSGATQLTLYGCKDSLSSVCLGAKLATGQCIGGYATQSRCEAKYTIQVGCAPNSASCGPNAFCDPSTFTCKNTASCSSDFDCAAQTYCDYSTKTIKSSGCINGQCGVKSSANVECCSDVNCATGYYCGSDYKCKQQIGQRTTCPFECCVGESQYFDKPCPSGQSCVDHKCTTKPPGIDSSALGWLIPLIVVAAAFFTSGGIKHYKDEDYDGLAMSVIFAAIFGLVAWYILNNLAAILAGTIILTILGAWALYAFSGFFLVLAVVIGQVLKGLKGD